MHKAHQVVSEYWATANARDWGAFSELLAEDVVYEGPQARERVRGRTAYLRFNAEGFFDLDHEWKIVLITDFWPTPSELPASRAHLVERY